jgi:hypothetical protein
MKPHLGSPSWTAGWASRLLFCYQRCCRIVSGCRYGSGMPNQPDSGDSSPPADRPPPGRKAPGRKAPGRKAPGGQPTPHDSVFRQIFGVPENAASQLRAVLPPGLAGRLDLGRLARVSGSFVDEALKWRHSDLLFTAPLDGRDALVYVLVEHQSSADPLMACRVLRKSSGSGIITCATIRGSGSCRR